MAHLRILRFMQNGEPHRNPGLNSLSHFQVARQVTHEVQRKAATRTVEVPVVSHEGDFRYEPTENLSQPPDRNGIS